MRAGDFTADARLILVSAIALVVGALCAGVAVALLALIAFFTNLFFYHRLSLVAVGPAGSPLGAAMALVPIAGGLVIGVMARYGSERIRGHGIPEALEAILIGRSAMEPRVAVLKPVSSAISIGSGGPFGAEGPIIMTGGAIGSIIAQTIHLTAAERKAVLVAGAAGGMSATFGTPLAAILLAVELLLFEWKPRSLVPVALASAVAAAIRPYLLGPGPLFPVPPHPPVGPLVLAACVAVGLSAGMGSAGLTRAVYAAEDLFPRVRVHWMWWPAIGGAVVGLGGLVEPRALGVGYDVIADLLQGRFAPGALPMLLLVKGFIWAVALGSGTSGGVLAPLLIIGGALGALEAPFLPGGTPALWPLVGMAGILAGTMRAPLTAIVFAVELTHDVDALLPLVVACVAAYGFTVLVMPRSILTEKVARRGHHLTREYGVDPLDALLVRDAMSRAVETVPAGLAAPELVRRFFDPTAGRVHQGFPVVDAAGELVGVLTRSDLIDVAVLREDLGHAIAADLIVRTPIVAYPDETCRAAAERMAESDVGRLVVVARDDPQRPVGIVTRSDLLKARAQHVELERRRERPLRVGRRGAG